MMTDFRALCAELTAWAEKTSAHYFQPPDVLLRARAALADEPPVPALSADGEVADVVRWLKARAGIPASPDFPAVAAYLTRAAELLERQALVAVSERPWERDGWCDTDGLCWLGSDALDGCTPTWLYGPPAWAERFPNVHRVLLPAHALPLPEVSE